MHHDPQDMPRHTFRCMATDIVLLLDTPHADVARTAFTSAEQEMHRLASIMTRFDDASELSHLNTAGTLECTVELYAVIEAAVDAYIQSNGLFNPTVHDAMIRAGYDRTFGLLDHAAIEPAVTPRADAPATPTSNTAPQHTELPPLPINLDNTHRRVTLHDGTRLDLGGIAKGWIADQICAQLAHTAPALVNAGGDIACSPRRNDEPWIIEIERDTIDVVAGHVAPQEPLALALDAGGIATSGIDRRRWHAAGSRDVHHHIIDPATGLPATTDVLVTTVIAESCTSAEVLATTLLLSGFAGACRTATQRDLPAIIVRSDGFVAMSGPLDSD